MEEDLVMVWVQVGHFGSAILVLQTTTFIEHSILVSCMIPTGVMKRAEVTAVSIIPYDHCILALVVPIYLV